MKEILAVALLLTVANAYQWNHNSGYGHPSWGRGPPFSMPPGHGNGRFNPFHNAHWYPQQQRPHKGFFESSVVEAEWVCRNPKTGDVMIIASEDGKGNNGNGHQWQPEAQDRPNYPSGDEGWTDQSNESDNSGESEPDDKGTNNNNPTVTMPPPTSDSPPLKREDDRNDPKYTGEGKIDIRLGAV